MTHPSPHPALARLCASWRRLLHNRKSMAELAACPQNELHKMAQDIGLGAAALWSLSCSHPGPSELMPQRLNQLGLDPDYVQVALTATYRDLERVCATCKAWRCCARDLANGDVHAGMSSYCPNAFTIDTLTVDWPNTPKH